MYDLHLFDKDQTLSSPFPAWALEAETALREVAKLRASTREMDEEEAFVEVIKHYNEKREATAGTKEPFKVFTWYWDFQKLIDALPVVHPRDKTEFALFPDADKRICAQYDRGRKDGIEEFQGIDEVLGIIQGMNGNLAILSDNRSSEVAHGLNKAGIDIHHFQAIACQHDQDKAASKFEYGGRHFPFSGKKPEAASIKAAEEMILSFGDNAKDIVVIGDNKADAQMVLGLREVFKDTGRNIAFAWAKYGAALTPQAIRLNNDLLNDPYRLGVEEAEKGIRSLNMTPDHILESPRDILALKPRGF